MTAALTTCMEKEESPEKMWRVLSKATEAAVEVFDSTKSPNAD